MGVNERIGPYEILDEIGRGGMGVVYRALQHEPVRREVALKMVVAGADSVDVLRRFEAERQSLAVMAHPSIANVYDAGRTDDGRPYFVMEYVDGQPLGVYCDIRDLAVDDRIRLFVQVCRAVQHAHQKGVIHRDLKPGNILVTEAAGEPLCKVIDFGIARATELDDAEHVRMTRDGESLGTPAYMSPEQLQGVADIDTRTDVYSLGVILYELMVGDLPFEERAYRGWAALAAILASEPPKPSIRFANLSDTQHTVAARRGLEPAELRRRLEGDLDWITSRTMEKERERRYDTPAALADDLERHLRHEPVEAGPPDAAYRLRKFVRRNRGGVIAASLILVALVGGAAAATLGMVRARRAEATARAAEAERALEAATATRASDFLVGLFDAANPFVAAGDEPTARDLLDLGAERIRTELTDEPKLRGRLLRTLADAYGGLGYTDERGDLLNEAARSLMAALGDDPATASSLLEAGEFNWAYRRNETDAPAQIGEAFAMIDRVAPRSDPTWRRIFGEVLELYDAMQTQGVDGARDRMDALLGETLAEAREELGSDSPDFGWILAKAAYEHPAWWGDDLEAQKEPEAWRREAIEIFERAGDLESAATQRENQALSYIETGRYDDAVEAFAPVLAWHEARVDPTEQERIDLAGLHHEMAVAHMGAERWDEAIALAERGIALYDELGMEYDPALEADFSMLADAYEGAGRWDGVAATYREYVARAERSLPLGHPVPRFHMLWWAEAEDELGNVERADSILAARARHARSFADEEGTARSEEDARAALRDFLQHVVDFPQLGPLADRAREWAGGTPLMEAMAFHQAGNVLSGVGLPAEAATLFHDALALRESALGPDHPDVAALVHNLALTDEQQGRLGPALTGYRDAMARFREGSVDGVSRSRNSVYGTTRVQRTSRDLVGALATFGDHERRLTASVGPDDPRVAEAVAEQGYLLLELGREREALAAFRRGREIWETRGVGINPAWLDLGLAQAEWRSGARETAIQRMGSSADAWSDLGEVRIEAVARLLLGEMARDLGRPDEAAQAFERAVALYESVVDDGGTAPDRYWFWRPVAEMLQRARDGA